MINQLQSDPKKIPQPTRDDMMRMLVKSLRNINVDIPTCYKALWLTSALDGSENYFVSDKIMSLVAVDLTKFRSELMKSPSPKQLRELLKQITPPKGVRRKGSSSAPADEGDELLDWEGEEMGLVEKDQGLSERENSDEDQVLNEAADKTPENNGDQGDKQQSCHTSSMLQLAPLCENEDLKEDAKFIYELGMLLEKEQTSTKFTLQVPNIKRQYIVARHNIKKRIEMEKISSVGGSVTELTQSTEETNDQALNGSTVDNLLKNYLFD